MIIHYQNATGQEKLLTNIIALQNVDDNEWVALTENNKTFRLFTSRIEMIIDNEVVKK